MADYYGLLVNTIWPLVKPVFEKGREEIGKKFGNDLYEVFKKYFVKDKQKAVLSNLSQEPNSLQNQKALNKELTFLLSANSKFSREIEEVLYTVSSDWALLIGKLEIYRKLKHKIELCGIEWADTLSDTDDEYKNDIKILEGKFHTIYKGIEELCARIIQQH